MALALAAAALIAAGCTAPNTCCPDGPPYLPFCSEGYYYYFHGNRLTASPSPAVMVSESPWRHLGRVQVGSATGSGVLVHANFVLTAAHVVMQDDSFPDAVSFSLTQPCQSCLPYGRRQASRMWVPEEWIENVGGSYDSQETRAYDWAVLEVHLDPVSFDDEAPDPLPMPVSNLSFSGFEDLTPRAAGYCCGEQADGGVRRRARPYATDGSGAFLGEVAFPAVAGARGGALYRTSVEGAAGMSGGPVWIEQGGEQLLVGLLVGSPQEACNQGENWVAGLSTNTRARIIQILSNGSAPGMVEHSWQSGGGGADDCPGLLDTSPTGGPCSSLANEGEADCTNPEEG